MIKARKTSEIKHLPISELSDEEIVKAAMHRLEAKCVVLFYLSADNSCANMFYRWKDARGKWYCDKLINLWNEFTNRKTRITNKNN
jgi:hypothetical protein